MLIKNSNKNKFLLVEPVSKTPYPPLGLMKPHKQPLIMKDFQRAYFWASAQTVSRHTGRARPYPAGTPTAASRIPHWSA